MGRSNISRRPSQRSHRALAARFRRFAIEECAESSDDGAGSRVYEALSETVAGNPALLDLARRCRVGQPIPNLLFAAVKRSAADFSGSELAGHYRRIAAGQLPTPGLERAFTEFSLAHRDQILDYLETRMVQTNEVGRCAYLMPGFLTVAAENPGRPLALIDVGASAGLNLNWDKYRYRYSTGHEFGPAASPVVIRCEARKELPELPTDFPIVSFRVGLDLAPVDLSDDEEYRWMQALIWPEHGDRQTHAVRSPGRLAASSANGSGRGCRGSATRSAACCSGGIRSVRVSLPHTEPVCRCGAGAV